MSPDQYCLAKTKQSGSSFYYPLLFLARTKRRALTALYAFCREVDDIVDNGTEAHLAQTTLHWWHGEIERLYANAPQHPITRALLPFTTPFALPKTLFVEILAGMEMDLHQRRYSDFARLQQYCQRVAGVVGELTVRILGYTHADTIPFAHQLGLALQLTNIIRDVGEDALRGRIYLPQDELAQFGVQESDILTGKRSPQLDALLDFQVQRADRYYQQALTLLPKQDRRRQRVSLMLATIYRALLKRIYTEGAGQVLTQRITFTPLYKAWLAVTAWLKN